LSEEEIIYFRDKFRPWESFAFYISILMFHIILYKRNLSWNTENGYFYYFLDFVTTFAMGISWSCSFQWYLE